MPCNVYWMDKKCLMAGCNKNVLTMLNLTYEQFIGKSYDELSVLCNWPEGLANRLKKDDQLVLNTGNPIIANEDPPLPNNDGTFSYFLTSRVPLKNQDGEIVGVAGISTDISALKAALRAAESANHAKTEFIANMSHDIRTPLTGVVGMAQMIEDTVTDLKQKEYAHMLGASGHQLLQMLNSILDVVSADNANESDLHEHRLDLKAMLHDLIELEQPTIVLKELALITEIDDNLPQWVITDGTKLHRILLNLIGNAIKFTDKGQIKITASLMRHEGEKAYVRFRVADTGCGIADELQHKVFDRFFRATPSYEGHHPGHGVGLHIAESYVTLLGGTISLESTLNVGTTFTVDLPLKINKSSTDTVSNPSPSEHMIEHVTAPHDEKMRGNNQTKKPLWLLIEDNATALLMLSHMVEQMGIAYITATTAEDGLQLAKQHPFHLIITDLGLPQMSGIGFTISWRQFELEQKLPPSPIIGLTAHADIQIKQECIDAGMNEAYT